MDLLPRREQVHGKQGFVDLLLARRSYENVIR